MIREPYRYYKTTILTRKMHNRVVEFRIDEDADFVVHNVLVQASINCYVGLVGWGEMDLMYRIGSEKLFRWIPIFPHYYYKAGGVCRVDCDLPDPKNIGRSQPRVLIGLDGEKVYAS